jgi:hypothetical protein
MNSREVAEALGTTPKVLRIFLRSPSSTIRSVGSSARYEFTASDVPTLRRKFNEWRGSGKPKAPTARQRVPKPRVSAADRRRAKDAQVWKEEGPVVLEDLADPDVRAKVRRIAAEQEDLLELRLLAAGLHITQR